MAQDDDTGGGLEDRVERLETSQGTILGKLDELLGRAHGAAEDHTERRLGRPSSVEDQVRAELERADKARSEAADKAAAKKNHETLAERLARLEEKPPEAPQPRRQRMMWGPR